MVVRSEMKENLEFKHWFDLHSVSVSYIMMLALSNPAALHLLSSNAFHIPHCRLPCVVTMSDTDCQEKGMLVNKTECEQLVGVSWRNPFQSGTVILPRSLEFFVCKVMQQLCRYWLLYWRKDGTILLWSLSVWPMAGKGRQAPISQIVTDCNVTSLAHY